MSIMTMQICRTTPQKDTVPLDVYLRLEERFHDLQKEVHGLAARFDASTHNKDWSLMSMAKSAAIEHGKHKVGFQSEADTCVFPGFDAHPDSLRNQGVNLGRSRPPHYRGSMSAYNRLSPPRSGCIDLDDDTEEPYRPSIYAPPHRRRENRHPRNAVDDGQMGRSFGEVPPRRMNIVDDEFPREEQVFDEDIQKGRPTIDVPSKRRNTNNDLYGDVVISDAEPPRVKFDVDLQNGRPTIDDPFEDKAMFDADSPRARATVDAPPSWWFRMKLNNIKGHDISIEQGMKRTSLKDDGFGPPTM